MEIEYFVL